MHRSLICWLATLAAIVGAPESGVSADIDEFKVKRQEVFEFTEKPTVTRDATTQPERFVIAFASKGFCDATVAVEDAQGKIIRHLVSGVLGKNAPEPFQKDLLSQKIVWDGKDDQGRYVENATGLHARVSLGLTPQFERTLYWEPKRRQGREAPLICPAPEGVYVYDGGEGVEKVCLYDHDGNYVRTVYPFPADKVKDVRGLFWHTFPHDARKLPIKGNFLQNTLLTCGTNAYGLLTFKPDQDRYDSVIDAGGYHYGQEGVAAWSMAVRGERIALANVSINRLGTDGSSGGMNFVGPMINRQATSHGNLDRGTIMQVAPRSVALSPDGKTLYATGYVFAHRGKASADIITNQSWDCFNAVMKVDMDSDDPPKLFAGVDKNGQDGGSDDGQFRIPTSVAVDSAGKVYVADYMNDRIQVFSPEGKFLRKIPVAKPAQIGIDEKADEICVFSYVVYNSVLLVQKGHSVPPTLTRLGPLAEPRKIAAYPLVTAYNADRMQEFYFGTGWPVRGAVDPWAAKTTVWLAEGYARENAMTRSHVQSQNICLYAIEDGKLQLKRDFGADVVKSLGRVEPLRALRQRLYVNPSTGRLYVAEGDSYLFKAFKQLVEIDPASGSRKLVDLPFDAEDMCFDLDGKAYLRSISVVGRYDPQTWREVPWDYGEERDKVFTSSSGDRREAAMVSGLALPANGGWHHGGMFVAADGHLIVTCLAEVQPPSRTDTPWASANVSGGKPYSPTMWPGRVIDGRGGGVFIHIWDQHGKVVRQDAVPGVADNTYGVGLDRDGAVYLLAAATRILGGKLYYNDMTGTLMKFQPNAGGVAKIISASPQAKIPLPKDEQPKRPADLQNSIQGPAWAEGARWFYGGVGWCGKNRGIGCACWNGRFALDYFARSFAPEMDRYSVAVLDSAGNVILRIGTYGNVDDGRPIDEKGGPAKPRSIGRDEVSLVHGDFVATDTDRRLFISDPGNGRIASVRLGYHATERVPLDAK